VTDAGLLLSLQGAPQVSVDRSRSGRRVTVRLENTRIASGLSTEARQIDQHGVNELKLRQRSGNVVELELQVDRRSPDWQIRSDQSHLLLSPEAELTVAAKAADPEPPTNSASRSATGSASRPTGRPASAQPAPMQVAEQPSPARLIAPTRQMATVQGISLDVSSSQLVIQTDRPVSHSAQWQGGMYVVTLSPAQLARQVSGPQFAATDPLRRVQLRQVDSDTVKISIQPATGVQFGELNAVTSQMLALQLQRATASRPTNRGNSSLPSIIPNGRIVVAIDPGHGGNDPGAVGIGGIQEADIVLAIGRQVARLLEQSGVQAVLTRSDDTEIDLQPRVDTAEQVNANLFVSIHANSMGMERPDVNGLETYYYSSGAALAQTIQNSMVSSLGMEDRGVRQARFHVIKNTTMPSVLVETGFVTGSDDAPRLASAAYQTQIATAIARGILQYIQQNSITGSR
jgi:N-acetylmuramoyl-L-alanine amidase